MRFRLRTLLIVLALGPPTLAAGWWGISTGTLAHVAHQVDGLSEMILPNALFFGVYFGGIYCLARLASAVNRR